MNLNWIIAPLHSAESRRRSRNREFRAKQPEKKHTTKRVSLSIEYQQRRGEVEKNRISLWFAGHAESDYVMLNINVAK